MTVTEAATKAVTEAAIEARTREAGKKRTVKISGWDLKMAIWLFDLLMFTQVAGLVLRQEFTGFFL